MFAAFPQFSKITLNDRDEYETFLEYAPPIQDISFAGVMLWWNTLGSLSVSRLNNNLVISYWQPGIEQASGLSLIGINKPDESICTILDYLKEKGEPVRLVHVPEFVVSSLRYPEQFTFTQESEYSECVVAIKNFYPLSGAVDHFEVKVVRALTRVGRSNVRVRPLNLNNIVNRHLLIQADKRWQRKGTLSDAFADRAQGTEVGIMNAPALGLQSICLYIIDELQGYLLYRLAQDGQYVLCYLFSLDPDTPDLMELEIYEFAKWFAKKGLTFANVDYDLGIPLLRSFRLKLRPVNFFRKYTIEPM